MSWTDKIFDGIKAVNRALQGQDLPDAACNLLYDIQSCLCSGDGLSTESPFRAATDHAFSRAIGMLGLNPYVARIDDDGHLRRVLLRENPSGVRELYGRIH